jgi:hypothetical protein
MRSGCWPPRLARRCKGRREGDSASSPGSCKANRQPRRIWASRLDEPASPTNLKASTGAAHRQGPATSLPKGGGVRAGRATRLEESEGAHRLLPGADLHLHRQGPQGEGSRAGKRADRTGPSPPSSTLRWAPFKRSSARCAKTRIHGPMLRNSGPLDLNVAPSRRPAPPCSRLPSSYVELRARTARRRGGRGGHSRSSCARGASRARAAGRA